MKVERQAPIALAAVSCYQTSEFLCWHSEEEQQALKDSVPFSGMQQKEICRGKPKQEILQPA